MKHIRKIFSFNPFDKLAAGDLASDIFWFYLYLLLRIFRCLYQCHIFATFIGRNYYVDMVVIRFIRDYIQNYEKLRFDYQVSQFIRVHQTVQTVRTWNEPSFMVTKILKYRIDLEMRYSYSKWSFWWSHFFKRWSRASSHMKMIPR